MTLLTHTMNSSVYRILRIEVKLCNSSVVEFTVSKGVQCSYILFILHVVDRKYIGLFKYRL